MNSRLVWTLRSTISSAAALFSLGRGWHDRFGADAGAGGKAGEKAGAAARTVEIIGTDDMKFNTNTINAKPGEQLRIRLTAKGVMPKIAMAHNVVVLKKGADPRRLRDGRRLGAAPPTSSRPRTRAT